MADKTTPKVVPIKNFMKPGKAVGLLEACCDIASEGLARSLSDMMGKVDDALFELAEKAENNVVQSTYFDAMREVRRKRKDMEGVFRQRFQEDVHNAIEEAVCAGRHGPATRQTGDRAPSLSLEGELSLVEDNHLETDLAVTNMVDKARHLCKEELFALDTRVGLLLNRPELKDEDNPFHPGLICNAFREACEELEAELKVKLIILKLFERFVVPDLHGIYHRLNEHLAENNILPRINYAIQRQPGTLSPGGFYATGDEDAGLGDDTDPFATIQQLMARRQGMTMPAAGTGHLPVTGGVTGGDGGGYGNGPGGAGAAVPVGRIIAELTQLQTRIQPGGPASEPLPDSGSGLASGPESKGNGMEAVIPAGGTVNVLRELKSRQVLGVLPQEQDQTIDIVAMLFDYILEDKDIPQRMKALIGRLQIPVLKVVMLDKSFFSRKNHPARKFLDTLSQAAIGLPEEQEDDALYEVSDRLVQRVLCEFEDDVEIFGEVLAELEAHLAEVERQAAEAEARLQQAAEEQARRERARLQAAEEVRRRLEKVELNPVVRTFLDEHWKTLLMMTFLMEGEESDAWLTSVETMDRLIWSIAPKKTAEERRRLVSELPGLLQNLRQGMELIDMPTEARETFFASLARCHSQAVSLRKHRDDAKEGEKTAEASRCGGQPAATGSADDMSPQANTAGEDSAGNEEAEAESPASKPDMAITDDADAAVEKEEEACWHDGIDPATAAAFQEATRDNEASALAALKEAAADRAAEILAQIEEGALEVEEITLGSGDEGRIVEEIEDEYTRQVQAMENGTWVAFRQGNGGTSQEKLTWINSVTGIYMFTNRNGKNTRNLTYHQFAEELRQGRAEVVAEAPLVDRAMSSLMNGLSSA